MLHGRKLDVVDGATRESCLDQRTRLRLDAMNAPAEPSRDAARLIAALFEMARRARNKTQSRTITTLMLKGGRPAHWLQETLLRDLERIGLVHVLPRGACTLTAVGREVAAWFVAEAQRAFPSAAGSLLEASMARLMNAPASLTVAMP